MNISPLNQQTFTAKFPSAPRFGAMYKINLIKTHDADYDTRKKQELINKLNELKCFTADSEDIFAPILVCTQDDATKGIFLNQFKDAKEKAYSDKELYTQMSERLFDNESIRDYLWTETNLFVEHINKKKGLSSESDRSLINKIAQVLDKLKYIQRLTLQKLDIECEKKRQFIDTNYHIYHDLTSSNKLIAFDGDKVLEGINRGTFDPVKGKSNSCIISTDYFKADDDLSKR